MTEKLYYTDAYIKEFSATVIDCRQVGEYFEVVLDKTAFFPEEGGQSADTGYIDDARVIDVQEREGVIYHLTDRAVALSALLPCSLDFDRRFDKMQQHTAEHIVCGIINKTYGFNNVGFHLGSDDVTLDIDGELTRAELDEVERIANEVVFDNMAVTAIFPSTEELAELSYRAKLDLKEGVRIVNIGNVDSCACCAPHVSSTGEIGLIKLLDFMRWKGGLRIHLAAGGRALVDYREKYESVKRISALLSSPKPEVAQTVERTLLELDTLRSVNKSLYLRLASAEAKRIQPREGNLVHFLGDMPMEGLIEFCNQCRDRVGGMTVAVSGCDGDYKYAITSDTVNLKEKASSINEALGGRGGGRGLMIQGFFSCTASEIIDYFK